MSSEKEMNEEPKVEGQVENTSDATSNQEEMKEKSSNPIDELAAKYNDLNDKYVRLHAEFDNFRRRTNKEKLDIISTAGEGVLKDLLPILDDFERAIANNDKIEDIAAIREGFHLIHTKMRSILESKGLKSMDANGLPFDSELHEAIAHVPAPDKKDSGKVLEAVEKGYLLNDKVIRYAKVVVAQ